MAEVTEKELRKVAKETNKKLIRERAVLPAIKTIFNRIVKESRDLYAANGTFLDAREFQSTWEALLDRHYRLTGNEFLGEAFDIERSILFESVLSAAFAEYSKGQSVKQAGFITQTNQIEIQRAFTLAEVQVSRDSGIIRPDRIVVSKLGSRHLKMAFDVRAPIIAQTETQNPAEHMKYLEANAVAGDSLIVDQPRIVEEPVRSIKKWVAVLDGKARQSHIDANGQEVLRDEPFIVGGDSMKYPADYSLGAKLGNIINCRCNALFIVEEK